MERRKFVFLSCLLLFPRTNDRSLCHSTCHNTILLVGPHKTINENERGLHAEKHMQYQPTLRTKQKSIVPRKQCLLSWRPVKLVDVPVPWLRALQHETSANYGAQYPTSSLLCLAFAADCPWRTVLQNIFLKSQTYRLENQRDLTIPEKQDKFSAALVVLWGKRLKNKLPS